MNAQRYVVFDIDPQQESPFKGGRRGVPSKHPALAESRIGYQELDPSRVAAARRNRKVAVARPMATRLVKPVAKSVVRETSGQVAWGVDAVGATSSRYTGKGVTVAILDTGIDRKHPAFREAAIQEKDFTGEGSADDDGHGTHCAGTIAGSAVNGYRFGIAPDVNLLIGKVLGQDGGTTDALFKAILWAIDEGAHIISMSLGFDFPGLVEAERKAGKPGESATSSALEAYRDNLRLFSALTDVMKSKQIGRHPALVVAATGNESMRSGATNPYTIGIAPPAAADGFVGVGAVEQGQGRSYVVAYFSNTGAQISGPGVDIISAEPGGGLVSLSGTSMATPHVAGVAALWAEQLMTANADIDVDILRAKLIGNARPLPDQASADVGSGLVQAPLV